VATTNANDGKKALDNRGNNRYNDNQKNGASQRSSRTILLQENKEPISLITGRINLSGRNKKM
jgi:hypothetical protein